MTFQWWPPISDGVTEEDYEILKRQQRCTWCGLRRLPNGHDPCLGTLPGVKFACCGHGHTEGYVMFRNGKVVRGRFDHTEAEPLWCPELEKSYLG